MALSKMTVSENVALHEFNSKIGFPPERLSSCCKMIQDVTGGAITYPRTCNDCKKEYSSKQSFSMHLQKGRCKVKQPIQNNQKLKKCIHPGCDFEHRTLPELLAHLDNAHNDVKAAPNIETNSCTEKKDTASNSNFYSCTDSDNNNPDSTSVFCSEKCDINPGESKNLLVCSDCSCSYSSSFNFRRHLENCQSKKTAFITCIDPHCSLKFRDYSSLMKHLQHHHCLDLGVKVLHFTSENEFQEWKRQEETNSYVRFVKNSGDKVVAGEKTQYFVCKFDVRERKETPKKTNQKKFDGDKIHNTDCPARLYVVSHSKGVTVKYISRHNHELSFRNVKHYRWPAEVKDYINLQLEREVPAQKIKEDFDPEDPTFRNAKPCKENFITTSQINKMKYEFRMKKRLNTKDAVSVQLLVNNEKESIILYKPQGKSVEIGGEEVEHLLSDPDAFVIGVQTDRQREEMEKGCERILCIDATHSTNAYDFYLVNLIVPDEYGVGYPIAHFITNRVDEDTMLACFRSLKLKNPNVKIESYMTDDDHALYNAFERTFGSEPVHLLCKWHVKRAWATNLNSKVKSDILTSKNKNEQPKKKINGQPNEETGNPITEKTIQQPSDEITQAEIVSDETTEVHNDQTAKLPSDQTTEKPCDAKKVEIAKKKLRAQELIKEMTKCLHLIIEEKNVDNFDRMLEAFLTKYEDCCPSFVQYFRTYYAKRPKLWAMCHRNFPHAATDTNMYCESFHNKLKTWYLNRKFNRRVDDLIYVLLRINKDLHLALMYKRLTGEKPGGKKNVKNCRHMNGLRILDEDVLEDEDLFCFTVKSQSVENVTYTVQPLAESCVNNSACFIRCDKSPCHNLCSHMYSCSCNDLNALCKHIHKVHSIVLSRNGCYEDITAENMDNTFLSELELFDPPIQEEPPVNGKKYENLISSCQKEIVELQTLLICNKIEPLLPHVNQTLKLLVSQCKGLISSETAFIAPPTMIPMSVAPNQHLQTQPNSFWRTTKKKGEFRKTQKLFSSEIEKNALRSSLLNVSKKSPTTQSDESVRQIGNFSGVLSTSDSLGQTVFVERPFNVKLYHVKSIDCNLHEEDIMKLTAKYPGFKKGWLYDCIIYSYLVRISKSMPEVKVIDPCASQVVGCPHRKVLGNENILNYQKLLIPSNPTNDHWVLLAVDPKEMVIEFYNPASNAVDGYHQFIGQWAKALAKNSGSSVSQWKVCVPHHKCQVDAHSCGVFVCWYSEQILTNSSTNASFDTQRFRLKMYDTLMK